MVTTVQTTKSINWGGVAKGALIIGGFAIAAVAVMHGIPAGEAILTKALAGTPAAPWVAGAIDGTQWLLGNIVWAATEIWKLAGQGMHELADLLNISGKKLPVAGIHTFSEWLGKITAGALGLGGVIVAANSVDLVSTSTTAHTTGGGTGHSPGGSGPFGGGGGFGAQTGAAYASAAHAGSTAHYATGTHEAHAAMHTNDTSAARPANWVSRHLNANAAGAMGATPNRKEAPVTPGVKPRDPSFTAQVDAEQLNAATTNLHKAL